MSNVKVAIVALVCLGIGVGAGFGINSSTTVVESDLIPAPATDVGGLSGTIDVGILLPLTGQQSTHGTENTAAAMLAIEDFNEHLETVGADWRMRGVSEDTATSPVVALEKLGALNSRGIQLIIGPETSAEIRTIKGYADSNGMLMFSPSSTAPSLAIPNDSVFRMISDDSKQGPAISSIIGQADKTVLIPVWRGDAWGDGVHETSSVSFAENGGITDEGIRYNPETVEFSATMSLLDEKVTNYTEEYGADNVAVLLIAFSEALQIMQSASYYDSLDDVKWYGTSANSKEYKIIEDPVAREFATNVEFTTIQIIATHNEIYERVNTELSAQFGGKEPNGYAFTSYDAAWVLGSAMLQTGTDDVETLKRAIPEVAERNFGSIGPTRLNEAGDLAGTDYDLWAIYDGQWVNGGQYFRATDTLQLNPDYAS